MLPILAISPDLREGAAPPPARPNLPPLPHANPTLQSTCPPLSPPTAAAATVNAGVVTDASVVGASGGGGLGSSGRGRGGEEGKGGTRDVAGGGDVGVDVHGGGGGGGDGDGREGSARREGGRASGYVAKGDTFLAPTPPPAMKGLEVSARWTLEPLHGGGGGRGGGGGAGRRRGGSRCTSSNGGSGNCSSGNNRSSGNRGSGNRENGNRGSRNHSNSGTRDGGNREKGNRGSGNNRVIGNRGSGSRGSGNSGSGSIYSRPGSVRVRGDLGGAAGSGEVGVGLVKRSLEIRVGKLELWPDPPVLGRISHLIRWVVGVRQDTFGGGGVGYSVCA